MHYKVIIASIILLGYLGNVSAQISGEITYDRKVYYSRIIDNLPYLSEEEKARQKLTWGKDEGWSHPYILQFDQDQTLYTYGEQEKNNAYSWKQDEFVLIHDRNNDKIQHQIVLGGKLYLVEDNVPQIKWKMLNEIREVEGFLCMKAETKDPVKDQTIHAWFTTEIPISSGPEGYGGLPGMILMLEINDGTAIIEASKVDLETKVDFKLPKKIKGKKVTHEAYTTELDKFFKQCIEGERNPYWQSRY